MRCEVACHLFDDYLDNQLSRYDAQRLEQHLDNCQRCAQELRVLPSVEQAIERALTGSARQQKLSAEASLRTVRAARSSLRRGIWARRASLSLRMVAAVTALALTVVGLLYLADTIPDPTQLRPISLAPMKQLIFEGEQPSVPSSQGATLPISYQPDAKKPGLSLSPHDVRFDPWKVRPGETFTLTLFLHSDLPQPLEAARFDLDVSGPTGYYRFEMTVKGPLPAQGVSVLQVPFDRLAASSQEKYLLTPDEILSVPGVYVMRVLLYSPVVSTQ